HSANRYACRCCARAIAAKKAARHRRPPTARIRYAGAATGVQPAFAHRPPVLDPGAEAVA
nr:hypothetical protein [Tanacetum cinerariifolium]